jgi:4-amino-4-deoxy-L-arabinose transferase-like glycosyltransferase
MSNVPRRAPQAAPVLLILLLAAFFVRAWGLADQSLWYDEGYSVMLARQDAARIVEQTARLDFNTPLHYLALRAWTALTGSSEFSARYVSVFAGVVTVALAAPLAILPVSLRRRRNFARGLAVGLVALSPMSVSVAQEARMYALLACLCALAVVQLLRAMRRGRTADWMLWAAWNLAAFLTHVIGAVFFAAQAAIVAGWWAWRAVGSARPMRWRWQPVVAIGLAGLGMAAFVAYILSFGRGYGVTFAARLDLLLVLVHSLAAVVLPHLQPAALVIPAAVGVALAIAAAGVALAASRNWGGVLVLGAGAAGLMAIAIFCALTGKFGQRYPSIVAPVLLAGISAGVAAWLPARRAAASPRLPFVAVAFAFAAGVLSVAGLVAWRTDPIYFFEDFRGAARHIKEQAAGDEAVVLVAGHFAPVFEYYYGPLGWIALPDDPVLDVGNQLDYESAVPALNQALAGTGGAWMLLWQDGVIDPTGIAQALLRRQSIDLRPQIDTQDFHGLRLQHYRFFQPYQALPDRAATDASRIEETDRRRGLTGLGCAQLSPPRIGGFLEVVCYWRLAPDSPLPADTQVSLRLLTGAGEQVAQADTVLAANGLPHIPYPRPIASFYTFPLPADLPAGDYALRVIPYTAVEQVSPQVIVPVKVLP